MAISDTKKDLLLGASVAETIKNSNDNFNTLFDNDDDLQTQINGKQDKMTWASTTPLMDGTGSAGSANTVARGDHRHPTDTSRLSTKPDGTNTLLDSENKIRTVYIPDSVMGQLAYKGTFIAATGTSGLTVSKGDYYICATAGPMNPDATTAINSYEVGDWAVYNGTSWDKVDNTDAVTLVNGQKGSVKTYKGAYSSSAIYYQGDTVLYDSCLYLYIYASSTSGKAPTDTTYWKIFGKVYSNATTSADGLMSKTDKANVDANTTARHTHSNKALLDTYTQTETDLADAVSNKHSHSNKALLDTYDQTNANIKDAVSKKHSHSNKTVLDNTTASYTTAEKTKLGNVDDSLLNKTEYEVGKIRDVIVDGTSVVDETTHNATITSYKPKILEYSATDSIWNTEVIDGTTYQCIAAPLGIVKVFNESFQEIVAGVVYHETYCTVCVSQRMKVYMLVISK